jgi:poly-beta-hydroxybutyrate-responsive repressor
MHRRRHPMGNRSRRRLADGTWEVRARIERVGEAALLLLLRERPRHGYELLDVLPPLVGEERVDVGNLYRVLRSLEEEGLVTSKWRADLPGPTKRTYSLTDEGRAALAAWLTSLQKLRADVDRLLARTTAKGGDHVQRETRTVGVARSEP